MSKKYYKYFTEQELACRGEDCCDHTFIIDDDFMTAMMHLRERIGCALYVSSYFRCNKHNKAVGGIEGSFHTKCKAIDVVPGEGSLEELAALARDYFEEVIVYDNFVHIANLINPYDSYM